MIDQRNQQGTQGSQQSGGFQFNAQSGYPLDNHTYNLMQALVSKCESIDAYRQYTRDDKGQLFQSLIQQEWNEAQQIFQQLKQHLGCR